MRARRGSVNSTRSSVPTVAKLSRARAASLVCYFEVGYGFERSGSYGGQAYTTDKEGNKQETFSMFDTVYLTGTQQYRHWSFEYPMIVPLYMFEDRDWSGGESLDLYERFGSTQITLSEGGIHNQSIWEPSQGLFPGSYDVIIDVDQDGFYSRANMICHWDSAWGAF